MSGALRPCRRFAVAALVLAAAVSAQAQLRVATWNVTQYSGGREADIQTAVYGSYSGRTLAPDVIVAQEFLSASATIAFRSALNTAPGSPGDWAYAYVPGPSGTEGAALLFRTSKLTYLSYVIAAPGGSSPLGPRNAVRFKVRLVGYTSGGAVLYLYNSHMKAAESGSDDELRRLTEAQYIRDNAEQLEAGAHFLLGSDLNITSSAEAAYQELVGSQANNAGRFFDPIRTPGTWNNTSAFRFVHTQDPTASWGGMDDRYDQLLVSATLIDGAGLDYVGNANLAYSTATWNDLNHSYRAWGNDGGSFNSALRTTGNTMVGATIAQAIINVAVNGGHIPVFLDLRVPPEIGADAAIDFGEVVQGTAATADLAVWNAGDTARWGLDGISDLHYTLTTSEGFEAPSDPFSEAAGGGAKHHTVTMDTATAGPVSGTLTIASDAPDQPLLTVALTGFVVQAPVACRGDCDCDGAVGFSDIDYFIAAVPNNEAAWAALYAARHGGSQPPCPFDNCDVNASGSVGFDDIDPFVALIPSVCP